MWLRRDSCAIGQSRTWRASEGDGAYVEEVPRPVLRWRLRRARGFAQSGHHGARVATAGTDPEAGETQLAGHHKNALTTRSAGGNFWCSNSFSTFLSRFPIFVMR